MALPERGGTEDGSSPDVPLRWQTGDSVPRRILEEVLRQTISGQTDSLGGVDPADLKLLSEVATRLKGQPFGLDPVLLEMVQASLAGHFPGLGLAESRATVQRIAQTLYDDPISRHRLERLWDHLSASHR